MLDAATQEEAKGTDKDALGKALCQFEEYSSFDSVSRKAFATLARKVATKLTGIESPKDDEAAVKADKNWQAFCGTDLEVGRTIKAQ